MLLRPHEIFVVTVSKFVLVPMGIITMIISLFIYIKQLRLLRDVKRKELLPIVLKESILNFIAGLSFVVVFLLIGVAESQQQAQNMILLTSSMKVIMVLCAFFMLNFNMARYYKCCYFCSFGFLKYICCAYQNGDELLLKQAMNYNKNYVYSSVNVEVSSDHDVEAGDDSVAIDQDL